MERTQSGSPSPTTRPAAPWNKGAFVEPKPPLKPKQVWSIRLTLQREGRVRDLALFDPPSTARCGVAILCGCTPASSP